MDKLKELRKSHGLTRSAMAEKIGLTLSMYEKVESGRYNASAGFMRRLKEAFPEISIDEIFFARNSNNIAVHATTEA